MKAREVIGRKIVHIEHVRFWNVHLSKMEIIVDRIDLDDGSFLAPYAFETIDTPQATIQHVRPLRNEAK